MSSTAIERDAAEHASLLGSEWRKGLFVARSVELGARNGRPSKTPRILGVFTEKVSAGEYARMVVKHSGKRTGFSDWAVRRTLKAWNGAAADGHVPPAETLVPGQEIDLDLDKLPDWSDYYPHGGGNLSSLSTERRKAYEAAAAAEGTTANEVARVAASTAAVSAAVRVSSELQIAVLRVLDSLHPQRSSISDSGDPVQFLSAMRTIDKNFDKVIQLAVNGHAMLTPDQREPLIEIIRNWRNRLDALEESLGGDSFEAGLARLLEMGA